MPRRRVLVVDDERLLAAAMCEVLSDAHDVEVAATVGQALRRLREDGGFDVVVCDAQLRDGTAIDVHRGYAEAWPERARHVLYVTGGTEDAELRAFLDGAGRRVVYKPFDLDELPRLIEEIAAGE